MSQKRVSLFGVKIDDISLAEALSQCEEKIKCGARMKVFTPNLEMLSAARKSTNIRKTLNGASLSLPDGFSLRPIAHLLGKELKNTVAGIDFGRGLIDLCAKEGVGIFLLGGKRGVAMCAAQKLKREKPDLKIYGIHHGYFSSNQESEIINKIDNSGARVVFVCLGFPRQELFAQRLQERLKNPTIIVCLGGSLDVWSGNKKRAPLVWRAAHLEWLWRVMNEPKRAGRVIRSLEIFPAAFIFGAKRRVTLWNKDSERGI